MRLSVISMVLIMFAAGCASPDSSVNAGGNQGGRNAGAASSDLANLGFAGLSRMGVPVECDVRMTDTETGETLNTKLYLKGRNFRSEQSFEGPSPAGSDECGKLISVLNHDEKKVYIGCNALPKNDECQWMVFNITEEAANEMEKEPEPTAGVSEGDLNKLPSESFSCKAASFGSEKFQIKEGKICDLGAMLGQTPEGPTETTIPEEGY